MLRRIILENFMSHGRTEIDLADGLTVLTGPNNCGKSAVIAALQILAANGKSNHVMRHGEKRCRIIVETDDGHEICWERKKTVVKYTLNGEDIHRVGSSVPDSVQDFLRLNQVEAKVGKAEHQYDIHFGEQKSPVFLLDQPGGRAASFFASSSDASRLVEMQHLHRQNVRERRAEAKRLQQEQQSYTERLKHYQPIEAIADRVSHTGILLQQIENVDKQWRRLQELAEGLRNRNKQCEQLRLQLQAIGRLDTSTTSPDDLRQAQIRTTQLGATVDQLSLRLRQQDHYSRLSTSLEDLDAPPRWHETRQISLLVRNLKSASQRQGTATRVLGCCSAITGPPELAPARSCRRLLNALRTESVRQTRLSRLRKTLASLRPAPEIHDTAGLATFVTKLTSAHNRTSAAQSVQRAIKPLQEPPEENATNRAQQLISDLKQRQESVSRLSATVTLLNSLMPPLDPLDPARLTNMIDRLVTSLASTDEAMKRSTTAAQQAADCEVRIRTFVTANPKCAACGADIDPDTILSHAPGLHDHSSPNIMHTDGSNGSVQP